LADLRIFSALIQSPKDFALRQGGKRRDGRSIHKYVMETLRNSDLVAVLPERLVRGQSGLEVVEPPLAVAGFEMLMLWHERWHRDPAHQWLRQFIVNSLEEQTC
ncbi:HTH-type transcriptional regulator SyrM 1, partial [Klebsiella pneumoniae]